MKNLLLIGFLLVILLTIPITLFLVSNKTNNRSNASAATRLNFIPSTKTVNVGDNFQLDISLDPGEGTSANSVAFVDLVITYPNNLTLQKTSDNGNTGIKVGTVNGASIISLTDPKTTCASQTCTMKVSLGMPPSNTVKTQQPIATMYFTAVSATDPNGQGAQISFSGSQALSIAGGDKPSDNILAGTQPAEITINGGTTPTPTDSGGGGGSSPTDTPAPTNSGGGGGGGGGSSAPVCSSLAADSTSATTAPATITFTASGNSANSTIAKATFNFGDGNVQDVTTGGGIGTNAVNAQLAHLYAKTGTFTASATLTDASGNTSTPASCSQTITIGQTTGGGTTPAANTPAPTSAPIPSTGPGETIMTIGLVGAAVMLVGGILFAL